MSVQQRRSASTDGNGAGGGDRRADGGGGGSGRRHDLAVHYMHGLESGPHGRKAVFLRQHFRAVQAPDQHISAFNARKRNSPMRPLLAFLAAAAGAVAVLPSPVLQLAVAAATVASLPTFLRWRLGASLDACVAAQARAVEDHPPDVVVASSWGGAVLLQCMAAGLYSGPAVILAPAVAVSGWRGRLWPQRDFADIPPTVAARCVVVCGTDDRVVPVEAVRALCAAHPGMQFVEVAGGDHPLNSTLIDTGRLRELVLRAHGLRGQQGQRGWGVRARGAAEGEATARRD